MLAWLQWSDDLCSGCGHPKTETMDPSNVNAYSGVPLQCHACKAARRSVDGWSSEELHGIYLSSRRDD